MPRGFEKAKRFWAKPFKSKTEKCKTETWMVVVVKKWRLRGNNESKYFSALRFSAFAL
jgi:hypothetical protein